MNGVNLATPASGGRTTGLARTLAALVLFGVSFGFGEAAVVIYLRPLYQPLHGRGEAELFPLVTLEQLEAQPKYQRLLVIELVREAATLVMLAAVGLAVARNGREWFAAFVIAFGVWDIFFYVFLKLLLDWPDSLLTWDLLFLLPLPWVGPVLAPVLVALAMIGSGVTVLRREAVGRPVRMGWGHWAILLGGGMVAVTAFCWDYRNTLAGGEPNPFNWPLFTLGLGIGLAGFWLAVRGSSADLRHLREERVTSGCSNGTV
jgi:hypothetical protein